MNAKAEQSLHLWLPALAQFEPTHPLRRLLARADRLRDGAGGYLGGLGDYFQGVDAQLPAAALTREWLAGDAAGATWLSADPAWVQPDLTGVRLLACGRLQLDMTDAQALATPLQPIFAEAGMQLEISTPDRWHLKLPFGTPLPGFAASEQALGEDLSQHLPVGMEGRRWRVLLNEIQVVLHNHPLNTQRRGQGLPPVNSVWLWGGGELPASAYGPTPSGLLGVISDDVLLSALASHAGIKQQPRTAESMATSGAGWLLDLQDLPASEIAAHWWHSLQASIDRQPVLLHFASGERWQRKPWHRWRFWRGAGQ